MSRVFWDTNLFIYLFEDYGKFSESVAELRQRMIVRGDQLLTSTVTLGEILVKPSEAGMRDLCQRYEDALLRTAVVLPFEVKAARSYGNIRGDRSIRPQDAMQLACAASSGVDLFVTNDQRLSGKNIPGIQFIVSIDRVPI
ncbi:MAG TPA: type II toxin-antitoxin system VapC family toxin [Terriglobales bacterium]|nr:type II toxin-antitoxin system VapC family toxin [Terriglobales bacterium]